MATGLRIPEEVLSAVRDPQRVEAVRQTGLLDSAPEESFDRLTRLAATFVGAPIALVNLVDKDRQFAKSCFAPEDWPAGRDLPLVDSFCKYPVLSREPLLIPDAREDPRVSSSVAVTELGLASYLGVPLIGSDGYVLGTLCVADHEPRSWAPSEVETLQELAAAVMTEIELRAAVRETEAAEQLMEIAERERRDKTALLESTAEGMYGTDLQGRCTFLNRAGCEMLGYQPEECLGLNMHDLIHHSHVDREPYPEMECPILKAFRRGEGVRIDGEVFWRKDGTCFPVEYTSSPIREAGEVTGAVVAFTDVTVRRREEEVQRFLSQTGKVIAASTLDLSATLRRLVRLSVPTLGDWCSLHIVHPNGKVERVEIAHADPARHEVAQALGRYPTDPTSGHPAMRVLTTGEPILVPDIPESMIDGVAQDDAHRELLRSLGMRSAMVVPLTARGRTVGALTCVTAESGRSYTQDDLTTAQEFADRAALAIDNARLFQESLEANRLKAEFLATISHELRTPLNAVTGYTELMREGIPEPLPPRSLEYVERIGLSARHLLNLIEEILTFSGLESGRETLRLEQVRIPDLLDELRRAIEPLAEDKGLRLVTTAPDDLQLFRTDGRKLRQILLNLLDNAVKFTDQGEVELSVSADDGEIVFRVRDTGIGIAEEDRDKVFEPFRQLEQSNTRSVGGTGLGLSLAERLVGLMGGTLELESVVGRGSTFIVRIPRATVGPARAENGHGNRDE